jgi:hypothetical protein
MSSPLSRPMTRRNFKSPQLGALLETESALKLELVMAAEAKERHRRQPMKIGLIGWGSLICALWRKSCPAHRGIGSASPPLAEHRHDANNHRGKAIN